MILDHILATPNIDTYNVKYNLLDKNVPHVRLEAESPQLY